MTRRWYRFGFNTHQEMAERYADAILRDVFQGGKDHLREQMMNVMAKANRRYQQSLSHQPEAGDGANDQ